MTLKLRPNSEKLPCREWREAPAKMEVVHTLGGREPDLFKDPREDSCDFREPGKQRGEKKDELGRGKPGRKCLVTWQPRCDQCRSTVANLGIV